jgi:hypothetical protein
VVIERSESFVKRKEVLPAAEALIVEPTKQEPL